MQARLEQHPDFETKLKRDPIAMLEAIKSLMHEPVRAQYHYVSFLTDQWHRLLTTKQYESERFKQTRDVTKSQMGTKYLDHFIENLPTYKAKTKDEQKIMMDES
jgi:hypothetical protein